MSSLFFLLMFRSRSIQFRNWSRSWKSIRGSTDLVISLLMEIVREPQLAFGVKIIADFVVDVFLSLLS
jgi:hypothetical protein